jgi:cellulose synthase/poly-beta-1,6-N-acetylglucosamine synthase-like glycosyltransferase
VHDWAFGLTDRLRRPKPALAALQSLFSECPFLSSYQWPRISVVVCTYNGQRTMRDCCEGLSQIEYPNFEVIAVNDGSTDATAAIPKEYGFRVISTSNHGLSHARNTGLEAATGEIVAYLDDDARPDPHWLQYIAFEFMRSGHAAIGGPNIPPPGDGWIAECVANAPGGPAHVLLSDRIAEHIPGCNMAFRKSALQAIGGFDLQYRTAGDDVDVCWRIQQKGWTIGFSPAAMVWHHRRNSVKSYWKQQYGYGKAEALLEEKWPEKFNGPGHLTWAGRVYNKGLTLPLLFNRPRIYQGIWGSAPFQSLHPPAPNLLASLVLMPEWYLLIVILSVLSLMSFLWKPLWFAFPFFLISTIVLILQAVASSSRASFSASVQSLPFIRKWKFYLLTAALHLIQPLARLLGRIEHGLTFWRRVGPSGFEFPYPRQEAIWSDQWKDPVEWLKNLEMVFRKEEFVVRLGGEYDNWDLEVRSGMFGVARVLMAVEEHGSGMQYVRIRWWPRLSYMWAGVAISLLSLSFMAGFDHAWLAGAILGSGALLVAGRILRQCSCAMAGVGRGVTVLKQGNA